MWINKLNQYCLDLKTILSELFSTNNFFNLEYSENKPTSSQFWTLELTGFWGDYANQRISKVLCYLEGKNNLINTELDINKYFSLNDFIISFFETAIDHNYFDVLIPVLNKIEKLKIENSKLDCSIGLESESHSENDWLTAICEELILIMHLDEKDSTKMSIGGMQNQRYKIRVKKNEDYMFYRIPFDKVKYFPESERFEDMMDTKYHKYEVALSFAGEDREYVSKIANNLRQKNIRVFYDEYEEVSLWGKDLYTHLDKIYRVDSKYCVLFLSQNYKNKLWTNHERISAQARAFEENSEYILPIKLDETSIPGIRPTLGYISSKKNTTSEIVEKITKKIHGY
mgnify:CR=1 FL=1